MRSYDVAITSLAVHAPAKWTDNLLSQHHIEGVLSARRGVARRITHAALLRIAIIRKLGTEMGIGVTQAVHLAGQLLASGSAGAHSVTLGGHLTLSVDIAALQRELDARLNEILESAPTPRRGRPPARHRTP